jgi:hypothetical protein
MPYIGQQPATSFHSLVKQDFSVSATTGYTLSQSVTSANDIALFINNVRQEPTTAYSASGTTLTLTAATASGDDMYCVYLGKAVGTVNPASGSVGLAQLSATGTKSSSTFLRGDNSFASINSPSFFAFVKTQHNLTDQVFVKVQFDEEEYDNGSVYDKATNHRFTCAEAGRYFLSTHCMVRNSANNYYQQNTTVAFYKNGAIHTRTSNKHTSNSDGLSYFDGVSNTAVLDLAVNDYIEVYCYVNISTSDTPYIYESNNTSTPKKHRSWFTGFKIGD